MTRKIIFALTLFLFLVGCQKDNNRWHDNDRPNPDGSIGFRLDVDNSQAEDFADQAQSKGTPHNTLDKYDSVSVNIFSHTSPYEGASENDVKFFKKIKLDKGTPHWISTPAVLWPEGEMLSFFAYASDIPFADAGISFLPTEGEPATSLVYEVPKDVTKQPDLLVSAKPNESQADNIELKMKHALACVSFCGISPDPNIYVKKITLRNVSGKGTLALNSSSIVWQVDPSNNNVTAFEPGIINDEELIKDPITNSNYLMTADGYLMMIPQTLKDAVIDVYYWNGRDESANKTVTYTLPVDNPSYATWQPGKRYIYKFGTQSQEDITVVYYEKYDDTKYGIYYSDSQNSLQDKKEIIEAGYGVLSNKKIENIASIRLTSSSSTPYTSGTVVELSDINSFLYPLDQSGANTFALPALSTPQDVYFNNSNKSCGMIIPHFAKGVYTVQASITNHYIRTPQQMRNITSMASMPTRLSHTYNQELNLDFAKTSVGGGKLTSAVVNRDFNDLFYGNNKRIENVDIKSTISNGGMFLSNSGEIKDLVLLNSSIISSNNTGGITAINQKTGVITNPKIKGENSTDKKFTIQGTAGNIGAIAGLNFGQITGSKLKDEATELPVAEVSGWVSVKGVSAGTGGIAGENQGTITTCLVQGVDVTGPNKGDVVVAQITIEGGDYVGGIVGINRARVDGNYSGSGSLIQAEPDVAGLVSISGNNWIGGIAGYNTGANAVLNQVNLRLGRGDAQNAIKITGNASVGGIVGFNTDRGVLKADGNSFISVRGNVQIHGVENVGGIVGNNQSGDISNCFVYNFYSQLGTLAHYAPKISGGKYVGGIVGYAGSSATISNCAVFSTVSTLNAPAGENTDNAMTQITATTSSAGGIVGRGFSGLNLSNSVVLGNVKVEAATYSGGIEGENNVGVSMKSIHIGNSGTAVSNIYTQLFDAVRLPVRDLRMKTNGGVMTATSGTPTIVGSQYVGGVCGVNWGTIDGISIKDNIKVGDASGQFVGGIAGGNGQDAIIKNCTAYNPPSGTATVDINGSSNVGGIVGVNNGILDNCQLGLPGSGSSRLITIKSASTVGGIAGINGGHENYTFDHRPGSGNDNTIITGCNIYGKIRIESLGARVGGILGQNGPTNRVIGCNVIGYTSSYTSSTVFNYDITLTGIASVGGIAGANYGDIHGPSASVNNKVTHTAVIATQEYAGGLVGDMKAIKTADPINSAFESKLYYCDVSYGVLIHTWTNATGAFVGYIDGRDASELSPTTFGTTQGGITNKIYTGTTTHPVRISAYDNRVTYPPSIDKLPFPCNPPLSGNLWAKYNLWNYLYWTAYSN